MANFDMAIDLGSDFVSVLTKDDDVLVKQYNYVAVSADGGEALACGNGAVKLYKNNPQSVKLVRPMDECNIKNKDYADCYFNWLFTVLNEDAFDNQRARILCVVPGGANANEKKQIETMFVNLGAKAVAFTEAPKAAQRIVSQEYKSHSGIVADIGSAIADFGCFTDGEMTGGFSLYLGGRQLDVAIKQFVEEQYNLHIELPQAEKIKRQCSLYDNNVAQILIEGVNYESRMDDKVEVPIRALYDVIANYINKYCVLIKSAVRSAQPEAAEKLKLGGIFLSGGVSKLEGIADYMSKNTGLSARVSSYGANSVIYGARLMLDEVFA
ncbi:MAG TPA: rod shape-determining protein [Firmicutes bacterium]|nr:rod shape-determining protein [Bacillota bacterium]